MKLVKQIMNTNIVTVSPSKGLEHAAKLMNELEVGSLLVMNNGCLIGILTSRDIRKHNQNRLVCDVMTRAPIVISSEASVIQAVKIMERNNIERLPVVNNQNQAVGLITKKDVLEMFGRLTDPMTGLAWGTFSKYLAKDLLEHEYDLIVIFFDIDDFGLINKHHGHIVGDQIIINFSQLLNEVCDNEWDLPGRYGGDEFMVLSKRDLEGAKQLASRILDRIQEISPKGGIPVGVSIGISGGKRKKIRDLNDIESMVDDLLNLASKASTEAKNCKEKIVIA